MVLELIIDMGLSYIIICALDQIVLGKSLLGVMDERVLLVPY